jgi:hypothetical protein
MTGLELCNREPLSIAPVRGLLVTSSKACIMVLLGFFLNKGSSLRSLEHSLNDDYPILLQVTRQVREHLPQVGAEHQVQAEGWQLSGRCVCCRESFPKPSQGGRCLVDPG